MPPSVRSDLISRLNCHYARRVHATLYPQNQSFHLFQRKLGLHPSWNHLSTDSVWGTSRASSCCHDYRSRLHVQSWWRHSGICWRHDSLWWRHRAVRCSLRLVEWALRPRLERQPSPARLATDPTATHVSNFFFNRAFLSAFLKYISFSARFLSIFSKYVGLYSACFLSESIIKRVTWRRYVFDLGGHSKFT